MCELINVLSNLAPSKIAMHYDTQTHSLTHIVSYNIRMSSCPFVFWTQRNQKLVHSHTFYRTEREREREREKIWYIIKVCENLLISLIFYELYPSFIYIMYVCIWCCCFVCSVLLWISEFVVTKFFFCLFLPVVSIVDVVIDNLI